MTDDKKEKNLSEDLDQNEDQDLSKESTNEESHEIDAKVEDLLVQIEDLKNQVLYAKAEAENIRRRSYEEADKTRKFAIEGFSQELLSVKDSLEASLSSDNVDNKTLIDGVELTLKQLNAVFEKFNIIEVNPIGEKFDPNEHQAMSMVESKEQEPNTVLNVLQKGYKLNDRVIRPAMVSVVKSND
ncbi:nucleotide exchange factor GrpE [Methylophilaceae bacterium]|jgi:molecular chaperone GrpE|nr:nucleotide exchange factor GrpE [Methylophilaceae bacterium]